MRRPVHEDRQSQKTRLARSWRLHIGRLPHLQTETGLDVAELMKRLGPDHGAMLIFVASLWTIVCFGAWASRMILAASSLVMPTLRA